MVASLRSVENPELATRLASAVMHVPLREVTDQVGRMTAASVGPHREGCVDAVPG